MVDIPSHWKQATLEEVGEWTGGGTPSKRKQSYWQNGNIPWVSPKDMKVSEIHDTEDQITETAIQESSAKRIQSGSVLFVTRSGILEHTLPTALAKVDVSVNQDLKALTPGEEISPKFLLHYTRAENLSILRRCSKDGTTVASLESSQLYAYPIPVPPLREQRRIVAKIEELFSDLDAGVADLKRAKKQLQRYRQSVLQAAVEGCLTKAWREERDTEPADKLLERILEERRAQWEEDYRAKYEAKGKEPPSGWKSRYTPPEEPDTSDLPELPEEWMWVNVDQVSNLISGQHIKTDNYNDEKRGSPYLTGPSDFASKTPQVSKWTEHPRAKADAGDVLVTVKGAGVGKTNILDVDGTAISRQLMAISPHLISSQFIYYFVVANFAYFQRIGAGSTVPGINRNQVLTTHLPLPPLAEQRQIVNETERLLSVADEAMQTVEREIKRAERLRQSILKQAFSGKLVKCEEALSPNREGRDENIVAADQQIEMSL